MNYEKVARMFYLINEMPEFFRSECNNKCDASSPLEYIAEVVISVLEDHELGLQESDEASELQELCDDIRLHQDFIDNLLSNDGNISSFDLKKLKDIETETLIDEGVRMEILIGIAGESLRTKAAVPLMRKSILVIDTELMRRKNLKVER